LRTGLRYLAGDRLPYFDFEKRVVGMLMAPPEVFGLVGASRLREFDILAVLLPQIDPVGTIFVIVPRVIIATVAIVIPLLLMLLSPSHYRNQPGCAQYKSTDN
jgi:hypothetical protein